MDGGGASDLAGLGWFWQIVSAIFISAFGGIAGGASAFTWARVKIASHETRLDALEIVDRRLTRVEEAVGELKIRTAAIESAFADMPKRSEVESFRGEMAGRFNAMQRLIETLLARPRD